MATITVDDATYESLTELAKAQGFTLGQYLEQVAHDKPVLQVIDKRTKEERHQALQRLRTLMEEQSKDFPVGFQVDVDRETIYREREDAQL